MIAIQTMKDQVYNIILHRIINLYYIPGQKISEKDLVKELKVGRTPIRESILQLRQEGLVNAIPQSGTYISKINLKMAKDARFMRESVEVKVISEAVKVLKDSDFTLLKQNIERQTLAEKENNKLERFFNEDEAFHHYFYTITSHEQLWIWLQLINMNLNRFRFLRLKNKDLSWDSLINEHLDLVNALAAKDESKSVHLVSLHLHRMLDEEPQLLKAFPEYFE